jgi:multiple sugar transport system substrate-binding protein
MTERLRLAYRESTVFTTALRRQAEAFRAVRPEVRVELVGHDLPELYGALVAGDGCDSGDWDAFLCCTDWLPPLMAGRRLNPLDGFLAADPPPDWPAGWSRSLRELATAEGRTYGIPYHDGPEMFMYRADLFDDPAEQRRFSEKSGYPLAAPRTWSQFLDVARHFTRPADDLYGCVLAALPDGHNNVYDFLIQLWSRGGRVLDGRRATFADAAGVAALTYLRELAFVHRVTQPDPMAYESVGSGEYYATGRAAMMWNWFGYAVMAELPGSAVRGRNRYALIPRGEGPGGRHVSLSVFWVLTIPRGAPQPELAWEFLRHTATAEMDLVTAYAGATGCRLSTWRDPRVRERFPCYSLIERTHESVEMMPAIPEYPEINEVLNVALDAAYTGVRPVEHALADAAARTDAILAR